MTFEYEKNLIYQDKVINQEPFCLSLFLTSTDWKNEHFADPSLWISKTSDIQKPCSTWATFHFKEGKLIGKRIFLIFISNIPQVKTLSCHHSSHNQRGRWWYYEFCQTYPPWLLKSSPNIVSLSGRSLRPWKPLIYHLPHHSDSLSRHPGVA